MNQAPDFGTRPLTNEEIAGLERVSEGGAVKDAVDIFFGTAFITFCLFAISFLILRWIGTAAGFNVISVGKYVLLALSLGISLFYFTLPEIKWKFGREYIASKHGVREELAGGVANTKKLMVTSAYELPEFDDEGVGFFLQLQNGRVLYVQGQDLYEHSHNCEIEEGNPKPPSFPSTCVLFSYGPKTGRRFSIEPLGEYLKPKILKKIKPQKGQPRDRYPRDAAFYPGTLEDIMKKFGLEFADKASGE